MKIISFILTIGLAQASVIAPAHVKNAKIDCAHIIKKHEKMYQIPDQLLCAIAQVESKQHPWAVNARGKSHFFKSKEAAVQHVSILRKKKIKNIGVGCMQINLSAHKFKSLDAAFDPENNIAYAAKMIRRLYDQYGSWDVAVKYYHTSNPKYNQAYKTRVYRIWNGKDQAKQTSSNRLKVGFGPGVGIGNNLG